MRQIRKFPSTVSIRCLLIQPTSFQVQKKTKPIVRDCVWINNTIKNAITKKNVLFLKRNLNPGNDEIQSSYIKQRNKVTSLIRNAKRDYFAGKINSSIKDKKQLFKNINTMCGRNPKSSSVLKLTDRDRTLTDPADIANHFNTTFVEIGPKLANNLPKTEEQCNIIPEEQQSMFLRPTNNGEILSIIKTLKNKKTVGHDSVPACLLKETAKIISPFLTNIINKCIAAGFFPDDLKTARVVPIHKEGSKEDALNYRPISILCSLSKVFERIVYNRLYDYFNEFKLLYRNQFGFRPKHNTIDALAEFIEKARWADNSKSLNCCIFIDLKKAFDTIDHKILLKKLTRYGVNGTANDLLRSYLTNRHQFVQIENEKSDMLQILCGVPQGSILGPLLFLIYINDLPQTCNHSTPYLFADDTNIFSSTRNESQIPLQNDLKCLEKWLNANKLSLNVSKTYYLQISKNHRISNSPELGGQAIANVECCKYLGIWVDRKLTFCDHINMVKKSISKHCGVISKIRHWIPKRLLILYYNYYIKPKIQYGVLIYGCSSKNNLNKILVVQKKILRLINFKPRMHTTFDLFFKDKILTVHELHLYELSKLILRSLRSECNSTQLNDLFIQQRLPYYSTRQTTHQYIDAPYCRTELMKHSLKNRGTLLINALRSCNLIPDNLITLSEYEIQNYIHFLRDGIIIQNQPLADSIFT